MNTLRNLFLINVPSALGVAMLIVASLPLVVGADPTQSPPNGNVEPPINVGSTDQVKTGGISVTNLTTSGDAYIDDQLLGGFGAVSTGGSTDWNDASNARAGSGYTLLQGNNSTNPPDSSHTGYWHPFSFEYGTTKDGGGNLNQFAIPYTTSVNDSRSDIYYRSRWSGTWAGWRRILNENASGRVGIGTSNPAQNLDVRGNLGLTEGLIYLDPGAVLFDIGTSASTDVGINFTHPTQSWKFGIDNSNARAFVFSLGTGLGTNDQMVLDTSGNLTTTGYNRTGRQGNFGRYDSSSHVQGIWSISPSYTVDTSATNNFGNAYGLVYAHTNAGTGNAASKLPIAGWSHQLMMTNNGSRNITFGLANGQIATAGICDQEGANCTTPAAIATGVGGDNLGNHTATQALNLANYSLTSTSGTILAGNGTSLSLRYSDDTHYGLLNMYNNSGDRGLYFGWGNGGDRVDLVIDAASKLQITGGSTGFGTSDPQARVHIHDASDASHASTDHGLTVGYQTSNNIAIDNNEIMARNNGGASTLYIQHDAAAGDTKLNHFSGNTGIGSLTPLNKLHVAGNIGATGWIGAGCEINCDDGGGQYVLLYADGRVLNRGYSGYATNSKTESASHGGVIGYAQNSGIYGILGHANAYGVYGRSDINYGVYGYTSGASYGVRGHSTSASHGGVIGYTANSSYYGILGYNNTYSFYGNGAIRAGGPIYSDHSSGTYDVWIQGGAAGASGTARNLALLGHATSDILYVNYNSEYAASTYIGGGNVYFYDSSYNNIYALGFIYGSDRKLKKDIVTTSGLDVITKLRGVDFTWKESGERSVGLIAQEVEQVLPQLVETQEHTDPETGETESVKSVQYGNIVAPLIEAVKEQQAQIETLEARIKALENKH